MAEIVRLTIPTAETCQFADVTSQIAQAVTQSGVRDGTVMVYVPHTTAGCTINENADPDVQHDILLTLDSLIPHHNPGYRHGEGNSAAHVKASLVGPSQSIMIADGRMVLGTWQGIYFCEFDGPRQRTLFVKVCAG